MNNVVTFVLDNFKYQVESDTIIDVTMKSGFEYKECRLIETTQMGDEIRVIAKDGRTTIPLKLIENVKESNPDKYYKRLRVSKR